MFPLFRKAVILSAAALAACAGEALQEKDPMHNIHVLGRAMETKDGLVIGWPASGVEMRVDGTRVVATIEDAHGNWMDVRVDGEDRQLKLEPGVHDYVLLDSEKGVHDVRLTRLSEVFDDGLSTIKSIDIDGEALPLPEKTRKILFLGDSITVGYGALGADETCSYAPETAAPWKSYASVTADAFGAERHLVAISGRGIVKNYDDPDPEHLMPVLFDMALPDTKEPWDHASFQPDVMVIHLGTNDFAHGDPGPSYDARYLELLEHARSVYPDAQIIAAIGPMGTTDESPNAAQSLTDVVARRRAAGDAAVRFIQLPAAADGHVFGCDYHPGLDSHMAMAGALAAEIVWVTGWKLAE